MDSEEAANKNKNMKMLYNQSVSGEGVVAAAVALNGAELVDGFAAVVADAPVTADAVGTDAPDAAAAPAPLTELEKENALMLAGPENYEPDCQELRAQRKAQKILLAGMEASKTLPRASVSGQHPSGPISHVFTIAPVSSHSFPPKKEYTYVFEKTDKNLDHTWLNSYQFQYKDIKPLHAIIRLDMPTLQWFIRCGPTLGLTLVNSVVVANEVETRIKNQDIITLGSIRITFSTE